MLHTQPGHTSRCQNRFGRLSDLMVISQRSADAMVVIANLRLIYGPHLYSIDMVSSRISSFVHERLCFVRFRRNEIFTEGSGERPVMRKIT